MSSLLSTPKRATTVEDVAISRLQMPFFSKIQQQQQQPPLEQHIIPFYFVYFSRGEGKDVVNPRIVFGMCYGMENLNIPR